MASYNKKDVTPKNWYGICSIPLQVLTKLNIAKSEYKSTGVLSFNLGWDYSCIKNLDSVFRCAKLYRMIQDNREISSPNIEKNNGRWELLTVFDSDSIVSYTDTIPKKIATETFASQVFGLQRAIYYKLEVDLRVMSAFQTPLFFYTDGQKIKALSVSNQVINDKFYLKGQLVWESTVLKERTMDVTYDNDEKFTRVAVQILSTNPSKTSGEQWKKFVWASTSRGVIYAFDYWTGENLGRVIGSSYTINAISVDPQTGKLVFADGRNVKIATLNYDSKAITIQGTSVSLPQAQSGVTGETYSEYCTGCKCVIESGDTVAYFVTDRELVTAVNVTQKRLIKTLPRTHFGCSEKTENGQPNVFGITNGFDGDVWVNGHTPCDYSYKQVLANGVKTQVRISGLCYNAYKNTGIDTLQSFTGLSKSNTVDNVILSRLMYALKERKNETVTYTFGTGNNAETMVIEPGGWHDAPNYNIAYREPGDGKQGPIYKAECKRINRADDYTNKQWNIFKGNMEVPCKYGKIGSNGGTNNGGGNAYNYVNRTAYNKKQGYVYTAGDMEYIHQEKRSVQEYRDIIVNVNILQDIGYIYGCGKNNSNISNGQFEDVSYNKTPVESSKEPWNYDGYRSIIRVSNINPFGFFMPFTSDDRGLKRMYENGSWWGASPECNFLDVSIPSAKNGVEIPHSDHKVPKPYAVDSANTGKIPAVNWLPPISQRGIAVGFPSDGKLATINRNAQYTIYQTNSIEHSINRIVPYNQSVSGSYTSQTGILAPNQIYANTFLYSDSSDSSYRYCNSTISPEHIAIDESNSMWIIRDNNIDVTYNENGIKFSSLNSSTTCYNTFSNSLDTIKGVFGNHCNNQSYEIELALLHKFSRNELSSTQISNRAAKDYINTLGDRITFGDKLIYGVYTNIKNSQLKSNVYQTPTNDINGVFMCSKSNANIEFCKEYNSDNLGTDIIKALGFVTVKAIAHPEIDFTIDLEAVDAQQHSTCDDEIIDGETVSKWNIDKYETKPVIYKNKFVHGYDELTTTHRIIFRDVGTLDVVGFRIYVTSDKDGYTEIELFDKDKFVYSGNDVYVEFTPNSDIYWHTPNMTGNTLVSKYPKLDEQTSRGNSLYGVGYVGFNAYDLSILDLDGEIDKNTAAIADRSNDNFVYVYERRPKPGECGKEMDKDSALNFDTSFWNGIGNCDQ